MKTQRVKWIYTHSLNSTSSVRIAKVGEYFGKIKHTCKHWRKYDAKQMAAVKFDGNKRHSEVPYDELIFLEDD